jgi:hypothetical protein
MSGIRIAMWSGPRNISTALMRSWESRGDTFVIDEPFYASYLRETDVDHPGRDEVIAACETDWRKVLEGLTGEIPDGKTIFYQKHMAHHVLPGMEGPWLDGLRHAFLLRDPLEMLISLDKIMAAPRLEDTGLPQQLRLFRHVGDRSSTTPPVVDAADILTNPEAMLRRLCAALGVDFTEKMLRWKAGPRETDGVWARFWYGSVYESTGFRPYTSTAKTLPEHLRPVYEECLPYYDTLSKYRLVP